MNATAVTETVIPIAMDVGAVRTVTVRAREYWNKTGIQIAAGQVFALAAKGTWTDLNIDTGPDGYEISSVPSALSRAVLTLSKPLLRHRNERYFRLMGSIGRSPKSSFPIGSFNPQWTANEDGELHCFANDVTIAYWNNRGSISLEVRRTS